MKRKLKKYFARAIPLFSALCVLVSVFAFSASAEPLNYRDYESSYVVDGDNDIVTVRLPTNLNKFRLFLGDQVIDTQSGEVGSFLLDPSNSYELSIDLVYPGISLSNIPADSTISFGVIFSSWGTAAEASRLWSGVYFYPGSSIYVGEYLSAPFPVPFQEYSYTFTLDSSYKTYSNFVPSIWAYGLKSVSAPVQTNFNIEVEYCNLTMSISSLYRQNELLGDNNELLQGIEEELEKQGMTMEDVLDQQTQTNEKLDDMINGEVTPDTPAGADKVDDLDSAESELRDQAQAGLDESLKVQQSALDILLEYAGAFAVFSWLFGLFADIPFLKGLLYVSMSIGLLASVLSIANSVSSFNARHAPKEPSIKYHYHWHSGYRNKDNGG